MDDCSASGVIHSEMPEDEFIQDGGRMHGFQLWVNLPKRDKMINPLIRRYQAQKFQWQKLPIAK